MRLRILVLASAAAAIAGCDPRVAADPSGLGQGEIARYFADNPAQGDERDRDLRDLVVARLRASHGRLTPEDQRALGLACATATTCTYSGASVLRDAPRLPLPGPQREAVTRYRVEVRLLPPDDAHVTVTTGYRLANG